MDILKKISGSILIIGLLDETYLSKDITDVFYMNNNETNKNVIGEDDNSIDVAKNIELKNMHKYFKEGIDNIYADFEEIKKHYPAFIRESLRITKKEIYICFKDKSDYNFILKKYERFNLKISKHVYSDYLLMKIEVNKKRFLKISYYYILDVLEKFYNLVSENI